MHFTEYATRVAAYAALVDDQGRMLLSWWNGEGHAVPCWSMPGGGVEWEETVQEAAVREVYEETGYHIELGAPLAVHSFTIDQARIGGPLRSLRIVFSAKIIGGTLGTTEIGGTTDFADWVPLAQIPHLEAKADIVDVAYAAVAGDARGSRPVSTTG